MVLRWLLVAGISLGCCLGHAAVAPWVDFTIVRGLVVIPTEVQGIKGYSVIDTGSQVSAVQKHFIEEHDFSFTAGRPMKISGVNGADVRKVYQNVPVKLMGAEVSFKQLVNLDIDPRMQLLIGGDFLQGLYFQFDYPNKRLRAISKDTFDLQKISNVKSRIDPATRQPMVKVRMNDEYDAWFVMDTGSGAGVLMKRSPAKKNGWLEKFSSNTAAIRGATAVSDIETFRLPVLEIGPYNVKNARVSVPLEGQPLEMFRNDRSRSVRRRKPQGLLGYDVLKNFLVTFDYKSGAVFVELPQAEVQN